MVELNRVNFPLSHVGQEKKHGKHLGKLLAKQCWQCRKLCVISNGKWEMCMNNCGPEGLAKMFRF